MSLPPQTISYATPSIDHRLYDIAARQKAIIYCILLQLIVIVGRFIAPPEIAVGLAVVGLIVQITAVVFIFRLAIVLQGTGMGIFLGILGLIPIIGLLVLLYLSSQATKRLKELNIKVGLMGADLNEVKTVAGIR